MIVTSRTVLPRRSRRSTCGTMPRRASARGHCLFIFLARRCNHPFFRATSPRICESACSDHSACLAHPTAVGAVAAESSNPRHSSSTQNLSARTRHLCELTPSIPLRAARWRQLFPVSGYKWSATPASVVEDGNGPNPPGVEKNVLMDYKFPNY